LLLCKAAAAEPTKNMSTQPQVETVSTGADKAKLAASALLLVGGIVVAST
jgi:hypothetical protein